MNSTKRSIMNRRTVVAVVVVLGLAAVVAEAKTTLRWKFKAGEVVRYQTNQTTVSKFKAPGGAEVTQSLTLTIDLAWTVKTVDPSGSATVTQVIERMRSTESSSFGKMSFDSRDPAADSSPAGPIFKIMVGSEITFTMSPRGEMTDIKLSDKLATALGGDGQAGPQRQFTEAGLKNMVSQLGISFPEGAVEVGEAWNRKLAVPAGPDGQTRDVVQTYTYKGLAAGSVERIDLATRFDPIKPDPNVPITIKSEQADGQVQFDNASGRIEKSEVNQRVDLVNRSNGMDFNLATETGTVMTLGKDKAP